MLQLLVTLAARRWALTVTFGKVNNGKYTRSRCRGSLERSKAFTSCQNSHGRDGLHITLVERKASNSIERLASVGQAELAPSASLQLEEQAGNF